MARSTSLTPGDPLASTDPADRPAEVVESVLRALSLLQLFESFGQPEMALGDLVRHSGLTKSTVLRLLRTLEYAGWIVRTEPGHFRLTTMSFRVGSVLVESLELHREARPFLVELAGRVRGSAFLWVVAGHTAVCLDRVDVGPLSPNMLAVGYVQPLHLGAGPRTLLAYSERETLPKLMEAGLEKRTNLSLTNLRALRVDLDNARSQGYVVSREDAAVGISAIGAPVFDRYGDLVGAVSAAGPSDTYVEPLLQEKIEAVVETARQLSHRLGHSSRSS